MPGFTYEGCCLACRKKHPLNYRNGMRKTCEEEILNLKTKTEDTAPSVPSVPAPDEVSHPQHYTGHPSGVECIQITEHMNFCLGNAMKYIWRAGLKTESAIVDLRKAKWYIDREIDRISKEAQ